MKSLPQILLAILVSLVITTSLRAQQTDVSRLRLHPLSLDFGNVAVGSSATLQATLSAPFGSVTITSDKLNSSEFSLPGLKLPLTLAAGQSIPVTIQFTPNASGTAHAKVIFFSNAVNSPKSEHLSGTGTPADTHYTFLSWDPDIDPVVGYNVYRSSKHGGPYTEINPVLEASSNYTDYAVTAGATYYYVVTAVNADQQESAPSNEVKVLIPNN